MKEARHERELASAGRDRAETALAQVEGKLAAAVSRHAAECDAAATNASARANEQIKVCAPVDFILMFPPLCYRATSYLPVEPFFMPMLATP